MKVSFSCKNWKIFIGHSQWALTRSVMVCQPSLPPPNPVTWLSDLPPPPSCMFMNVSTTTSPPATRLQVLPFAALVALLKRHPNLWNKMRSVEFWKLWLSLSSVLLSCTYCQNWGPPPAFYFKLPGQQNNGRHIYTDARTYMLMTIIRYADNMRCEQEK